MTIDSYDILGRFKYDGNLNQRLKEIGWELDPRLLPNAIQYHGFLQHNQQSYHVTFTQWKNSAQCMVESGVQPNQDQFKTFIEDTLEQKVQWSEKGSLSTLE